MCVETGKSRLHERRRMKNGLEAEIVEYKSYKDITVKFLKSKIVKKANYNSFKNGTLTEQVNGPKTNKEQRLHMTKMMKCGEACEIIATTGHTDITVRFVDTGLIKHTQFSHFKKGDIANWNRQELELNKVQTNKYGLRYKIICKSKKRNNYEIEFEDGAKINSSYKNLSSPRHPNFDKRGNINDFHGYTGKVLKIDNEYWWNIPELGLKNLEDTLLTKKEQNL